MSFDVDAAGGYGSGSLGDVTNPDGQINSYALVSSFGTHTDGFSDPLTIVKFTNDTKYYSNGIYHDLTDNNSIKGVEVMIVNFAQTTSGSQNRLGEYRICKVVGKGAVREDDGTISEHILRLDQNINSVFVGVNCYKMIITIPHFKNLTLTNGNYLTTQRPRIGNTGDFWCGGYVAFKCSGTFTMEGSSGINLQLCGHMPLLSDSYRQKTTQEANGLLDTDLYAGVENSIAKDHLILNRGDGACWVLARSIVSSGSARIGNPEKFGVQYCRGATDSPNRPSGATIHGGSTICVVCQYWTGFSPEIISKYKSGTDTETTYWHGLARAYLAINSRDASMIPDEGLYALDTPKTLRRPKSDCNIGGFGRGTQGSMSFNTTQSMTKCFNDYLSIHSVADDGYRVVCHGFSTDVDPLITRENGSLVMIHMTQKSAGATYENGRFFLARVVSSSSDGTIINHPCTFNPETHYVQMIVIPEFTDLTIKGTYSHTQAWYQRAGGIFAIACSGTCNLSTAVIDLTAKGTFLNNTNKLMDNSNMRNRLPIGQGNGSAFILAKNLVLSLSTRIGGTYSGVEYGGNAVKYKSSASATPQFTAQGGYAGVDGTAGDKCDPEYIGTAGWGGGAGTNPYSGHNGGWFSNAPDADPDNSYPTGYQGAHIFIAADTITNFNLAAISTGGAGGGPISGATTYSTHKGGNGGAGYGGGGYPRITGTAITGFAYGGSGGYRGGGGSTSSPSSNYYTGGGGAGACFIYCNNVANQSVNGIITV